MYFSGNECLAALLSSDIMHSQSNGCHGDQMFKIMQLYKLNCLLYYITKAYLSPTTSYIRP